MLDGGVGEQAFDVASAVEHEGGEQHRNEAGSGHQRAGGNDAGIERHQHLETQDGVERDVQKQTGEHSGDRCRAFGMGVRQPGMQRRETDLGAIAEEQEDEGDIQQTGIEAGGVGHQRGPDHAGQPLTDDRFRRHINKDGAEQGEGDADAGKDEVFPGGLQRLVRAVDADHEHGRQRGQLDRHPHQADIVGDQRHVHAEHHHLVHGVVETEIGRCEAAGFQLVPDIGCAEDAGCEADQGVEHDEDDVQVVHQEVGGRRATPAE